MRNLCSPSFVHQSQGYSCTFYFPHCAYGPHSSLSKQIPLVSIICISIWRMVGVSRHRSLPQYCITLRSYTADVPWATTSFSTSVLFTLFQVDGGIAPSTIDNATDAGANVIVSSSVIFSTDNPSDMISLFQSSVDALVEKRMACS